MNTRLFLSAALAAGVLFVPTLVRAQAPADPTTAKSEAKVKRLENQVSALQAEVKQLQALLRIQSQIRDVLPNTGISPFYQMPGIQGFQRPGNGFGTGNGQVPQPQVLRPQPYWNIPPCEVTLINRAGR